GRAGLQDRRGVARRADAGAVRGPPRGGHRARVHRPLLERARGRDLPLCRLRRRAVLVANQVRLRHGLAELHRAGRGRGCRDARRQLLRDGPHRGGVPQLRRPPGSRLPGRAARSGRAALLHQLRLAAAGHREL
ncbi:MAG: Peptide-methionine (R)-S-oxide reductase MsrB, partial [uncultured Solirubrobacteraceae bacterium]